MGGLAAAWPAAWLAGGLADSALAQVAPAREVPESFMPVSRLLTGHDEIRDEIASRAWSALSQRHDGFADRFSALETALSQAGIDQFAQLPEAAVLRDASLKETAVAIVSAWYLGRVGTVDNFSETASSFVTYADALMWAPTVDVTVIPTYSRAGPGHWAKPPHGVTPR